MGNWMDEKIARTFSIQRQEIMEKEKGGVELKARWPALFSVDDVRGRGLRQKDNCHLTRV
ncbi:hypothetical protein [Paraclostridium dentum]|uniref:hypothetical protein n=1 Tax=Paraclostridium dentum TaxID=2662455 RepID=UPI003F3CF793